MTKNYPSSSETLRDPHPHRSRAQRFGSESDEKSNSTDSNAYVTRDEVSHNYPFLRNPRRSHAQQSRSDDNPNASNRNPRLPRGDASDSSSEEGLGEFVTSRDRESDSDATSSDRAHASASSRHSNRGGSSRRADEATFEDSRARQARRDVLMNRLQRREDAGRQARYAGMDRNERLRHEIDQDCRAFRLSLSRDRREDAHGSSASSDTNSDEPMARREYQGRGIGARGDNFDNRDQGPSTPRGYATRAISARREEYEDDYEGPSAPQGYGGRSGVRRA